MRKFIKPNSISDDNMTCLWDGICRYHAPQLPGLYHISVLREIVPYHMGIDPRVFIINLVIIAGVYVQIPP